MDSPQNITALVKQESAFVEALLSEVRKRVIGQSYMIERIMIGMLTGGHVLLEGVPGLAKTLTVNTLAQAISVQFQRIQFTPDLLPADVIGTMIYNQHNQEFEARMGPIFTNILLADEINRAPRRCSLRCLRRCRRSRSRSAWIHTSCPSPSSCWRPRTPLSKKVPTRSPKLRWIVSCSW